MKLLLKIFFVIFLLTLIVGFYLKNNQYPKADIIIGLNVLFMSFILMPLFIYYRYKDGKYKKYIINHDKKNDKKKVENFDSQPFLIF